MQQGQKRAAPAAAEQQEQKRPALFDKASNEGVDWNEGKDEPEVVDVPLKAEGEVDPVDVHLALHMLTSPGMIEGFKPR